jgi:hypothetical protein
MNQDHVTRAPWGITTLVSCLPVLVLGMGTALAHMLRGDAAAVGQPDGQSGGPVGARSAGWSANDQPADQRNRYWNQGYGPELNQRPEQEQPEQGQDHQTGTRITVQSSSPPGTSASTPPESSAVPPGAAGRVVSSPLYQGGVQASLIALRLIAAGKPVSRRALRNGGVKGSNASLNALARQLNAEFANEQAAVP